PLSPPLTPVPYTTLFRSPWTPSATAPGMPATGPWGSRRWCTGPSSGGTGPAAPGTAAGEIPRPPEVPGRPAAPAALAADLVLPRSAEHTTELQSRFDIVC